MRCEETSVWYVRAYTELLTCDRNALVRVLLDLPTPSPEEPKYVTPNITPENFCSSEPDPEFHALVLKMCNTRERMTLTGRPHAPMVQVANLEFCLCVESWVRAPGGSDICLYLQK